MKIYVPLAKMAEMAFINGFTLPVRYYTERAAVSGDTIIITNGPKGDRNRSEMIFDRNGMTFKQGSANNEN